MLTPKQTLDQYYLEARRDLLEVAALLDRYDEAVKRSADESVSDPRLGEWIIGVRVKAS